MSDNGLHRQCQRVVQQLLQKYQWRLLDEEVLVAKVWEQAQVANVGRDEDLVKLAKAIYSAAWYAACKDQKGQREQAFQELSIELYKIARQQYLGHFDLADVEEITQTALVLVWEQLDNCHTPAAFIKFCMYKLRNAATSHIRQEIKTLKHTEPLPDEGSQHDE
jgi:hypothetical protein